MRWYRVSAQLPARIEQLRAWLEGYTADGKPVKVPLSVTLKGRLFEVVRLDKTVYGLKVLIEIDHQPYSQAAVCVRPISKFTAYYWMLHRLVWSWHKLPKPLRQRIQLFTQLKVSVYASYRLLSSFRYHYPAPDYNQWLQRYWQLNSTHHTALQCLSQRASQQLSYAVLIDARNATQADIERSVQSIKNQSAFAIKPLVWLGEKQSAIAQLVPATTNYILWLPAGVTLKPAAIAWFVWLQLQQPTVEVIYSDHDEQLSAANNYANPAFKPDWSLELQRSTAYVGDVLWVEKTALLQAENTIGMKELSAYAVAMEIGINTTAIAHIPAVLWSKPYATAKANNSMLSAAQLKQLQHHLNHHKIKATAELDKHGLARVRYQLPAVVPLVSIIIPTRDMLHLLQPCINSILSRTQWINYEIVVVDNQSSCPHTLTYLQQLSQQDTRVRVLQYNYPFNYSAINNYAVEQAQGDIICLLNNDTEVIEGGWLQEMVSRVLQPQVGVVGARLYYTDGRVQHAGDVIGVGGCAAHLHGVLEADDVGYMHRAVAAQDLSAVTAACLVTPKDLYQSLGGLNATDLTVAFNDVDYCLRVREAGYTVIYTPYAELHHHESISRGTDDTPEKKKRAQAEVSYMRKRWPIIKQGDPYYNPNLNNAKPDFSLAKVPVIDWPWRY